MSVSQLAEVLQSEPRLEAALQRCVEALRRMAEYSLDDNVNRRMRQLGEHKEFLTEEEHAELMTLVDFTQKRTLEKLDAQLALDRLGEILPGLVGR